MINTLILKIEAYLYRIVVTLVMLVKLPINFSLINLMLTHGNNRKAEGALRVTAVPQQ